MELIDRVAHRLKLRDLRLLDTVIRLRSMAKAATRLNISQPAVSKAIAELEHVFAVLLIVRNRQGIEPTEYGRALLDCGLAVFDELRQGVKNIEFLADPAAGEVRIGNALTSAASFVAAVIDRLSRRHPRIVFHLVPAGVEILHRELSERNIDFVIARRGYPFADDRFGYEMLYDVSYVVVAGAKNPWARRRRIELAELVSELWTLPSPKTAIASVAMEAFHARGLDYPRTTVVTDSPQARISLLADGCFLTIVQASALRFPTKRLDIKVLPVELPMADMPFGVVTLKNRTLSATAQLFIDCAREVAKPLSKAKAKTGSDRGAF
jgi:DNA-binding transcriptional LysR family regulator